MGRTKKRKPLTDEEVREFFARRYYAEHDLNEDDAKLMRAILNLPADIVKCRNPIE